MNYFLCGNKVDFSEGINNANTFGTENIVYADLVLKKDLGIWLKIIAIDAKTFQEIDAVSVKYTDYISNENGMFRTNNDGSISINLNEVKLKDLADFNLFFSKKG